MHLADRAGAALPEHAQDGEFSVGGAWGDRRFRHSRRTIYEPLRNVNEEFRRPIIVSRSVQKRSLRGSRYTHSSIRRKGSRSVFSKGSAENRGKLRGPRRGCASGKIQTGEAKTAPFYDGVTFHRVIGGFMIEGRLGTGTGGPGYKFADEFHPSLRHSRPACSRWRTPARTPTAASFSSPWPYAPPRQPTLGLR